MARARRGRDPAAQGAAPPQRHDLSLEPRRATASRRRQAAPAHREPRACPSGPSDRRRGRERRVLARADGRARRATIEDVPASHSTSIRRGANFYTAAREGLARALHVARRRGGHRAAVVLERLLPLAEAGPASARASPTRTSKRTSASSTSACARCAPARAGRCRSLADMLREGDAGRAPHRARRGDRSRASRPARPVAEWERARLDEVARASHGLPTGRAVHADRPLHRAPERPDRDRREPHDLGAHPPRSGRGREREARRPGHVPCRTASLHEPPRRPQRRELYRASVLRLDPLASVVCLDHRRDENPVEWAPATAAVRFRR